MRRLRIVVGITGGIAAYKAVGVVRELVLAGHHVDVIATEAALRFVGKPTLEAISRNPVHTDLFDGVAEVRHVALGQGADMIVIAPATADSIAKIAHGLANDLLGNTVLASTAPLVIAPAMHTEMWLNPATQANVATLTTRGVYLIGPISGQLTGEDSGLGRMEEPDVIVAAALTIARSHLDDPDQEQSDDRNLPGGPTQPADLDGLRVLISAGGTREAIDSVRFLGNHSSGKQGTALATAAGARGADVVLVAANLEVAEPPGCEIRPVSSAAELADAMHAEAADADIVIMAAAVADYRPETVRPGKITKEEQGETLRLDLVRNPDVLAELTAARDAGRAKAGQLIVGFAAETEPDDDALLERGRRKIARKGCDLLVVNRVGAAAAVGIGGGFGSDDNTVIILDRSGSIVATDSGSKLIVAHSVLDAALTLRQKLSGTHHHSFDEQGIHD